MKKFFLIFVLLILLTACGTTPAQPDPSKNFPKAQVDLRLDQVLLGNSEFSFDLYLDRPDLKLKEPANENSAQYTADLPKSLQPRLMYASEPDDKAYNSGTLCGRSSFPHRCTMYSDGKTVEEGHKYLIKIVFEDDTYAEKEIEVPFPQKLENPKILFPTETPSQSSTFKISFIDVGADNYEVQFRLCKPYANDGINPCLDGDEYNLTRVGENFNIQSSSSYIPSLIFENGIIEVRSSAPLSFEESINYTIIAHKKGKTKHGVSTYVTSSTSVDFPVND